MSKVYFDMGRALHKDEGCIVVEEVLAVHVGRWRRMYEALLNDSKAIKKKEVKHG
jgi:hypothetical protein